MDRLTHYWAGLQHKTLRLTTVLIGLVAVALLVTNPVASVWSHVGGALLLVEVATLTFAMLFNRR